ncbi:MAG: glyoxalase [Flavobacterium sp.]|uniref:glyoxalase n=1 Tax=unclassified Flavobacterium TaxID=196869 RepID=UPI0012911093|nr:MULTISPECIES: glyoxalase [unclassified Flavobacterium]MDP5028550.1 glyoxalase [Flavobacterium sp.]MDP5098151.1 glyoxalase [Flavobacterium sp.]MQP52248.1 glyoxalase [Flavobacterium sp. LMO9]MQP62318.1 glyoxalase [Flavobacterium sp. LMO6]
MKTKDEAILEIRGESIGTIFENSSIEEKFQNQTLRPILKFQNDLFIEVFKNYATKQKGVFFTMSPEKKLIYIENAIQRDIKFRNSLKGIVIGMFTISEYKDYIQNSSNINKRMMNLLIERLKSQIQII